MVGKIRNTEAQRSQRNKGILHSVSSVPLCFKLQFQNKYMQNMTEQHSYQWVKIT